MERISPSQIREFIHPEAFSRPIPEANEESSLTSRQKRVVTKDQQASLSLLLGAEKRVGDLLSNLDTMRALAEEGRNIRNQPWRFNEVFGKLRSLTAGFDQVVDQTQFSGKPLFDGREIELNTGAGTMSLDLENINAGGEDSLDLIKQPEGARARISYEPGTLIRNQNSGLKGLDIKGAIGIEPAEAFRELENGKYQLEIIYQGAESIIELKDQFGGLIEKKENVNLAGSGNEWVNFDSGIQLDIEKLQLLDNFDKWDWEADGPVSLFADLTYEKVTFHELQDGAPPRNFEGNADFIYRPKKDYQSPALNFDSVEVNGVQSDRNPLEAGNYGVKVKYRGENSIIELYDQRGRLRNRLDGVDLSASGKHSVDLGVGMSLVFENRDMGSTEKTIQAQIEYSPADREARTSFDFESYLERIDKAIATVEAQATAILDAKDRILQIRQWQQQGASGGSSISPAASLLGSAGGNSSILGVLNGGGGTGAASLFSVAAQQLFQTTSGSLNTQGNLPPNVLSY